MAREQQGRKVMSIPAPLVSHVEEAIKRYRDAMAAAEAAGEAVAVQAAAAVLEKAA